MFLKQRTAYASSLVDLAQQSVPTLLSTNTYFTICSNRHATRVARALASYTDTPGDRYYRPYCISQTKSADIVDLLADIYVVRKYDLVCKHFKEI